MFSVFAYSLLAYVEEWWIDLPGWDWPFISEYVKFKPKNNVHN